MMIKEMHGAKEMMDFFVDRMKKEIERGKNKTGMGYFTHVSACIVDVIAGLAYTSNDLSAISAYINDLDSNCRNLFFRMADCNDKVKGHLNELFKKYDGTNTEDPEVRERIMADITNIIKKEVAKNE